MSEIGTVLVELAGVERRVLRGSLTIRDLLNAAPNTCSFEVMDTAPTVGQAVEIMIGDGTITPVLFFSGSILSVDQVVGGRAENQSWAVTCQDHTRTINRRKVRKRYAQQSATDIALDLMANYTSGFTTDGIVAALPTVTGGIEFTEEELLTCLTRMAARIGGYADVDYEKDVRLFLTEASDAPDPLEAGYPFLNEPAIASTTDTSQIRTRVYVEGGGSAALSAIVPGETKLPVGEPSWYESGGGVVVSGPQRITYTGLVDGGTGGIVGPGAAPSAAPALAMKAGSGVESGVHEYAATFTTAAGESIAGPIASITVGTVPVPSSAPNPSSLSSGGSVTAGDHDYAVTFVTATGETTPGPFSSVVTTGGAAASPPASAPTAGTPTSGGSVTAGTHEYATTFVAASGETAPGPRSGSITAVAAISNPSAMNTPTSQADANALFSGTGTLKWAYTFRRESDGAETALSPEFSGAQTWTGLAIFIPLAGLSSPPAGYVRQWYRVEMDGSTFKRVPVNSSLHLSTNSDYYQGREFGGYLVDLGGGLGANAPASNGTALQTVPVTVIPTGPVGTTARKLYRTKAGEGGGTLWLVTTINNNSGTTHSDTIADGSLGAAAPSGATLNTVNLTAIPIGNPAVTSRKLYRRSGGAGLKLLATIADNSTTVYTDTTANASLGAAAPGSNTATANQVSLSSIPIGGTGVTARKVYRTTAGGSQLKLLTTLADNSTTTYNDSTADVSLGANAPVSDNSGLAQPEGQVASGSTALIVANTGGFLSAGGWAVIGNGQQIIRYAGITVSSLTGIPASGPGALVASIAYNSSVTQAPMLIGIPASGAGSILYDIPYGQDVNLLVQVDDVAAQTALAGMEGAGSDGIYEHFIQDRRLSFAEAQALGNAELALFAYPIVTLRYATRDPKTRSGKTIHVDLPELNLLGDFTIQSVTIDQIGTAHGTWPRYTVEASSVRFSLEDVLRRLQLAP